MISQLPDAVKTFNSAERKYEKNENGNGNGVEGCRYQASTREHELLTGRLIVGGTRGVSSPKFLPDS